MKRKSKLAKYAGKDLLNFNQGVCVCTAATNSESIKNVLMHKKAVQK